MTGYAVSPSLPSGLSLDAGTGVISGTPAAAAPVAAYTVTASNGSGSTTASLTLTVAPRSPPAGLAYSTNPATYTVGTAIAPNTPSSTGGAITSYAVAPPLPSGIALDPVTGVLSGTPVAAAATAAYTVTGANSDGNTNVSLTLTVSTVPPPAGLTYSANPAVYTVGTAITPNTPSSTGGPVASYSVAPGLPPGLSLDAATGAITGTPTAGVSAIFTVTATNPSGSATVSLSVSVNAAPPPGAPSIVSFTAQPASIVDGSSTLLAWDVQNATELVIEPSIGTVTGSTSIQFAPTVTTTFTLSATNATGTSTLSVTVTVTYLAPTNLRYSQNPATYARGTPIPPNVPSSQGGVVFSYSVSPPLPDGLVLDPVTGAITGTPAALATASTYTVTAANPSASTTVGLGLTVEEAAPPGIVTQPANKSALRGSTATFAVVATGFPPLTYQWRRNGLPLADARSASYTTPSLVATDDRSSYSVVVTDGLSRSVASSDAVLTLRGFFPTGSMAGGRFGHTATMLGNGKVLLAGGNSGSASLATAVLYDPGTGTFSATGSMGVAREGHAAVLLGDGRVLVAGGCTAGAIGCTDYLRSAEIYDPATGAFTSTGSLATPRTDFAAALLPGGQVLVAGGFWLDAAGPTSVYLSSAEVYDHVAGGFGPTASSMSTARRYPVVSPLSDGTVLVAGGRDAAGLLGSADRYDPNGGIFTTTGSLAGARQWSTATLLGDGQVLVAGGAGPGLLPTAERYAASPGAFASTGALTVARALQTATLLAGTVPAAREVLVAGGDGAGASAEVYDPTAGVFSLAPPMAKARSRQTATLLPNGKVLVAGGTDGSAALSSAELWAPDL